jgi:malto-oligosyltrehalose trehalohydrolase
MPFGAKVLEDGRVRFLIWAPVAQRVELCLEIMGGKEAAREMDTVQGGWFELATESARAGTRYRFRIDGALSVPDPASRFNPDDVHGASQVIDPQAFKWHDESWRGRPWEEAVIYELHVGAFTSRGTFSAIKERLDYLVELGVTAIELMPVGDFPGFRNWGYDGVLPFAPDSRYGHPEELKDLVQTAHGKGLMVFLDVVYNHMGPEGNYLFTYAPQFFTKHYDTPWGPGINVDGPHSEKVRDFLIHNALYWLDEFHLDGLRLDAVHTITDESSPDFLTELAEAVRQGPGSNRHVHLMLENASNASRYLQREPNGEPQRYNAQWNDDFHHALHVLLTGEDDGYYVDFKDKPVWYLGRCLAEGFAYQGEASLYRRNKPRGEPSRGLPATAFVTFLQNHDQVGNRPFGERIAGLCDPEALRAAVAVLLLAPSPPLLFMGEEFAAEQPFLFFCDFEPDLAAAVAEGRRKGFARFAKFRKPEVQAALPDPNDPVTYTSTKLNWGCLSRSPHSEWLQYYRRLLAIRHKEIVPRLAGIRPNGESARFELLGSHGLAVRWTLGDGARLTVLANLGEEFLEGIDAPSGKLLFESRRGLAAILQESRMPPWSVAWFLKPGAKHAI